MNPSKRIASIDWMRGFVMLIMALDHVSMAYNQNHLSNDSAALYQYGDPLPVLEFFTRWVAHICAPVFIFLAGTALAISVERKVAKGVASAQIDRDIFLRGAFIALLDPTIISFFSGRLTFQVLFAIGVSMMCMVLLRRASMAGLMLIALSWWLGGEWLTAMVWPPQPNDVMSIVSAFFISTYSSADLVIKYPVLPWLSVMVLGWAFGRYLLNYQQGLRKLSPDRLLFVLGMMLLMAFMLIRYWNEYGNLWLYRYDDSIIQWLHVSKYPPSISYLTLELGMMAVMLAGMMQLEKIFGVRSNGVLLVFGQNAMFFYLVHRIILEGSATYLGLRHFTGLEYTYLITFVILVALYPLCLGYRRIKARYPNTLWAKYI